MKEIFLCMGIIFISIFMIEFLFKNTTQEKFNALDIITNEMRSEEKYQKCLDQNYLINKESQGKYKNCHQAVRNISRWGLGADDNIGYGKMGNICPVACFKSTPSDCLLDKISDQEKMINNMKLQENEYNISGFDNLNKITTELDTHSRHIDNLYQKGYVQDFLDYQYNNGIDVSDPLYNQIVKQRLVNVSENEKVNKTPGPTLFLETVDQDFGLQSF